MGFITKSLEDVKEQQAAPEGEHDLVIIKATEGESKKGIPMVTVMIGFEDSELDAPPFFHYIRDPGSIDDEQDSEREARNVKRFNAVFGLEDDWEAQDLKGERATCMVVQEVSKDDGETRNKLRLPRLKD